MRNPNTALVKWVHNLTSSRPFKEAIDCTASVTYVSNPIISGETPVRTKTDVHHIGEIAQTKIIQKATIEFTTENGNTHEDYICEISPYHRQIRRKVFNLRTLAGKSLPFSDGAELPYVQYSSLGALPEDTIRDLNNRRQILMPEFLTDLVDFLFENNYYGLELSFGSRKYTITSGSSLAAIGKELTKYRADINKPHISALRKSNPTDLERFDLSVANRRFRYDRLITRNGSDRTFGQSTSNIPLCPFSDFAHEHFAKPTDHAFANRIYTVGEPMAMNPPESIRMF